MIPLDKKEAQQILEEMDVGNYRSAKMFLQAKLEEQCFCDKNNLGEPGVSCGDCPTRDYHAADPSELVKKQAEDAGLWFAAQTAPEAYLQQALRDLHRAVDRNVRGNAG